MTDKFERKIRTRPCLRTHHLLHTQPQEEKGLVHEMLFAEKITKSPQKINSLRQPLYPPFQVYLEAEPGAVLLEFKQPDKITAPYNSGDIAELHAVLTSE